MVKEARPGLVTTINLQVNSFLIAMLFHCLFHGCLTCKDSSTHTPLSSFRKYMNGKSYTTQKIISVLCIFICFIFLFYFQLTKKKNVSLDTSQIFLNLPGKEVTFVSQFPIAESACVFPCRYNGIFHVSVNIILICSLICFDPTGGQSLSFGQEDVSFHWHNSRW